MCIQLSINPSFSSSSKLVLLSVFLFLINDTIIWAIETSKVDLFFSHQSHSVISLCLVNYTFKMTPFLPSHNYCLMAGLYHLFSDSLTGYPTWTLTPSNQLILHSIMVKSVFSGTRVPGFITLVLPLGSYVILDKLFNFSVPSIPHFPYLKDENHNNIYFIRLF